jgi:small subunit ribosomal protein S2
VQSYAEKCGMPYINERWLGGMLTNFETMAKRVAKMKEYQRMRASGEFEAMPKKEALLISRELDKLERNLGGIRDMEQLPDIVFVLDTKKEHIAVTEANKLGIPLVAVVDTNCDPDVIQYVIPGNDDAIRSGDLMCRVIADAVLEGASSVRAEKVPTPAAPSQPPQEDEVAAQQAEARRQAALAAAEREARIAAGAAPAPMPAMTRRDRHPPPRSSPRPPLLTWPRAPPRPTTGHREHPGGVTTPMSSFTAKDVQALRQATGAGMMDAKKALTANDGDFDAAAKWLREQGLSRPPSRTDRENTQGAVAVATADEPSPWSSSSPRPTSRPRPTTSSRPSPRWPRPSPPGARARSASSAEEVDQMKITKKENIEVGKVVRWEVGEGNVVDTYLHVQEGAESTPCSSS